jgi:SAM-dependent methyltransferase
MGMNAEALFNNIGEQYEATYGNSPNLNATVEAVLDLLPAQSIILDVGSGTGKPVSHMLAAAGHRVKGIDISERMVGIARCQVPEGIFERADMRTYKPPTHSHHHSDDSQQREGSGSNSDFDTIFAVYSLYQVSPADTHAMIFRFAEWLKSETGILVLGVTPAESISSRCRCGGRNVGVCAVERYHVDAADDRCGVHVEGGMEGVAAQCGPEN